MQIQRQWHVREHEQICCSFTVISKDVVICAGVIAIMFACTVSVVALVV